MYITYAVRLFWVDVPQRQGEILRRRLSRRRAQPQSQSSETKKKLKDIYIYIFSDLLGLWSLAFAHAQEDSRRKLSPPGLFLHTLRSSFRLDDDDT
jgi:hypothetical protein